MPIREHREIASKPMRWESAELLARNFTLANLAESRNLEREVLEALRDIADQTELADGRVPSLEALTRWERQKKADVDQAELAGILNRLSVYLTGEQMQTITDIFERFAGIYFDRDYSGPGVWNRFLPRVFEDGYKEAYVQTRAAALRGGVTEIQQAVLPAAIGFSLDSPIIQNYYNVAYQRVTSKLSISFKGQFIGELVTGLESGLSWREIARNIHRVAMGARYHWSRLTRTEMTFAYRETMQETFSRAGVKYLFYSPNIGACPVCKPLRGYYTYGNVPWPPIHPNCLCRTVPHYRLPNGAEVKA